ILHLLILVENGFFSSRTFFPSRKAFSSCHQCILFSTACEASCVPHSLWQSHDRVRGSSWTVCSQQGDDHSHRRPLSRSMVVRPLAWPMLLLTAHVCSKLSLCASSQEHRTPDFSITASACVPGPATLKRLGSNLWLLSHRLHPRRIRWNS